MMHKFNELLSHNCLIILLIFIQKLCFHYCQIYDNFTIDTFEEGSQLLEVKDYNNLELIVTTSKKIYTGIPPELKSTTEAKLINSSSIITLNSNYLLVACLQDSLLTKININDGGFSSLLNYSDIETSSLQFQIPITSCSLSILENLIFIGYTQIEYYETETNKTNFIIRLNITNKDSDDGPIIDFTVPEKIYKLPNSTIKTNSPKQIDCEPIKIKKNNNNYRLVCALEMLEYHKEYKINRYYTYVYRLNENLDGIENSSLIYRTNTSSGFKLRKINDTYVRGVTKKAIVQIYLEKSKMQITNYNGGIYDIKSNPDLFDYNNGFIFFIGTTNFSNHKNIYYFKIAKETYKNYYEIYDYKDENIQKLLCYYGKSKDYIICLYQYLNDIKYFIMYNTKKLYEIKKYNSKTLKIASNSERYFDANNMLDVTNIGNLNVIKISRYKNEKIYKTENFGIDFHDLIMNNNNIPINKSFNDWYDYHLSFVENIENNFTRIFYIKEVDINFTLRTCYPRQCESCRTNYSICDDCKYENYALIINDKNDTCYENDKLLKGYIYSEKTNFFEKCYSSCNFCSSSSFNILEHKCISCANGYLPSYNNLGNCYIKDDTEFKTNSCLKYQINSTGECVEECPTSNFYYSFNYNEELNDYDKKNINLPKYLFNDICYETCPFNTIVDNENNTCKCEFAFLIDDKKIICFDDNNCPSEYPYQNPDTKECYSSLDKCLEKNKFFFNNNCYTEKCPNQKLVLNNQNDIVKNYFINTLLIDDSLIDNLCICDFNNEVWINISSSDGKYYQECFPECPQGFKAEIITHHCVEEGILESTEIISPTEITTSSIIDITNTPTIETTTVPTTELETTQYSEIITTPTDEKLTNTFTEKETIQNSEIETISSTDIMINANITNSIIPSIEITNEYSDLNTVNETNLVSTNIAIDSMGMITDEITTINSENDKIRNETEISFTVPSETLYDISSINDTIISSKPLMSEKASYSHSNLEIDNTIENSIFLSEDNSNESDQTKGTDNLINNHSEFQKIYPDEYYEKPEKCLVIYNNKCYNSCPENTCLSPEDDELINCIPLESYVKVYNNICFKDLDVIVKNIKEMSDNSQIISKGSNITINAYSTEKTKNIEILSETNYSILYLGNCENLLKRHYNLSESTELYILGIESPNKQKDHSTNVYNYGIFLGNGTQLDHLSICKNETIKISSVIVDKESAKLENASYFSQFGYDIYDEKSSFYTDSCAPAFIDGKDLILKDRKKYYYPHNVSLCNDSCHYIDVDLQNKRFTCECELIYNFSENNNEEKAKEEDIKYSQYLLSFINYKIITCYGQLFNFENIFNNIGFYIAASNLIFCLLGMGLFLILGLKEMDIQIIENEPSKSKKDEALKRQENRRKSLILLDNILGNPIKRRKTQANIYNLNMRNQIGFSDNQSYINNEKSDSIKGLKETVINNYGYKKNKINKKKSKRKGTKRLSVIEADNTNSKIENKLLFSNILQIKNNNNSNNNFKRGIYGNESKNIFNVNDNNDNEISICEKIRSSSKRNSIKFKKKKKKRSVAKDIYGLVSYTIDEEVDKKEYNKIPYTQALRIDKRHFFETFISFLANEIDIIKIFYYRNPYSHISITLPLYTFELCLDLTFNCFLCNDDIVSQKYHNGNIQFITSLFVSCMANIISSFISFIVGKLVDYEDIFENILKEILEKEKYYITFHKFKKFLAIKLTLYFIIQTIVNVFMLYYLVIFCKVYQRTQINIVFNYLIGVCESVLLSLGIALLSALMRIFSLQYRWPYVYYISKHLFETSNIEVLL